MFSNGSLQTKDEPSNDHFRHGLDESGDGTIEPQGFFISGTPYSKPSNRMFDPHVFRTSSLPGEVPQSLEGRSKKDSSMKSALQPLQRRLDFEEESRRRRAVVRRRHAVDAEAMSDCSSSDCGTPSRELFCQAQERTLPSVEKRFALSPQP